MQVTKPPPPSSSGNAGESPTPWRRVLFRLRQRLHPPPLRFTPPRLDLHLHLPLRLPARPHLDLDLDLRERAAWLGAWLRRLAGAALWRWLALGLLLTEVALVLTQVRTGFAKPFWYDEQWRAYHMSVSGSAFWQQYQQANAPIAGGWILLEKGATLLFGNVEVALRLPVVLSFALAVVFTWRVGRRLLGGLAGLLVAGALAVNGPLFEFVPELKPYEVEAMAAVAVLLLWLWAAEPDRGLWSRLAAYTGIGLLAVLATAVVFVIVPLLALDLAQSAPRWRSPLELVRRLAPAVIAGGLTLAHLKWFVLRQSVQLGATYWRSQFVPHGSAGQAWRFASAQLAGWVPEVVTGTLRPSAAISWLLCLALLAGTVVAVTVERRLLVLPVTLYGALALQYVAAAKGKWPFGFVRVNLLLVPLVYLLAGAGIARSIVLLGRFDRSLSSGRDGGWQGRVTHAADTVVLPLALALAVVLAGWGVVPDGLKQIRVARDHTTASGYGDGIRAMVQQARELQVPGTLAVVCGAMGAKGWAYYMWDYTGWAPDLIDRPPIGPDRTLLMRAPDQRGMLAFLAAHKDATQITVLYMRGTGPPLTGTINGPLLRAGYRNARTADSIYYTGHLDIWVKR